MYWLKWQTTKNDNQFPNTFFQFAHGIVSFKTTQQFTARYYITEDILGLLWGILFLGHFSDSNKLSQSCTTYPQVVFSEHVEIIFRNFL